jgi:hypothetical protein
MSPPWERSSSFRHAADDSLGSGAGHDARGQQQIMLTEAAIQLEDALKRESTKLQRSLGIHDDVWGARDDGRGRLAHQVSLLNKFMDFARVRLPETRQRIKDLQEAKRDLEKPKKALNERVKFGTHRNFDTALLALLRSSKISDDLKKKGVREGNGQILVPESFKADDLFELVSSWGMRSDPNAQKIKTQIERAKEDEGFYNAFGFRRSTIGNLKVYNLTFKGTDTRNSEITKEFDSFQNRIDKVFNNNFNDSPPPVRPNMQDLSVDLLLEYKIINPELAKIVKEFCVPYDVHPPTARRLTTGDFTEYMDAGVLGDYVPAWGQAVIDFVSGVGREAGGNIESWMRAFVDGKKQLPQNDRVKISDEDMLLLINRQELAAGMRGYRSIIADRAREVVDCTNDINSFTTGKVQFTDCDVPMKIRHALKQLGTAVASQSWYVTLDQATERRPSSPSTLRSPNLGGGPLRRSKAAAQSL